MKIGISTDGDDFAEYYEATVVSVVDYYPFGSAMAGRKYNQGSYRYGFNGKEEDKEWGSQMIQDYGFRIYNPTIGKFLSVDPLSNSYPSYTPYQFAGNTPIMSRDLDGLEEDPVIQDDFHYKGNLIVVFTETQYNAIIADSRNENWDVILSKNGLNDELIVKMEEYMTGMKASENGDKLQNFVLKTHGCSVGIEGCPTCEGTTGLQKNSILDYQEVIAYTATLYSGKTSGKLEEKRKEYKNNYGEDALNQIDALYAISTHLSDDATVIFTNCLSGKGEFAEKISQLFYMTSGLENLTIYTNRDYGQEVDYGYSPSENEWFPVILGGLLSNPETIKDGWKKTTGEASNKSKTGFVPSSELMDSKDQIMLMPKGEAVQIETIE